MPPPKLFFSVCKKKKTFPNRGVLKRGKFGRGGGFGIFTPQREKGEGKKKKFVRGKFKNFPQTFFLAGPDVLKS